MATLFAITAGGNWSASGTWASSSGGAGGAGTPTATDDVILDSNSGNVTITAAAACRSLDCTSGTGTYAGTLTHNATFTLSIGTSTVNASSVALKFTAGMTYTLGNVTTSAVSFVSTSATQVTFTSAGKTFGNVTFNGTNGSWLLSDGFTVGTTATVTLTLGTLNTNGQTCSWGFINANNSNARTLTLGSSSITLTGTSGTIFNLTTITNLTITANSATITFTGATATFAVGSTLNFNGTAIVASGSGNFVMGAGTPTFASFTRTGTAVKTDSFSLTGGFTVTGTLTLTGNSAVNRLLVQSGTIGSTRTITAASVSITNVDFMDIAGAGTSSPFTGTSLGNCLGNSGITFDAPTAQTWNSNTSGNWSTAGNWTSRVPLPQDNVAINGLTSVAIVCDVPRIGNNIDFTGSTGGSVNLTTSVLTSLLFGSLTLVANVSIKLNATQANLSFAGRGSANTIKTNGGTIGGFAQANIILNSFGGTYTLQDAFTSGPAWVLSNGTLKTGGNNMTFVGTGQSDNFTTASGTTLDLSTSTVTLSGGMNGWSINSGTTMIASSATIVMGTSTVVRTFTGGGKTYGALTINGTNSITISDSNTIGTLTMASTSNLTLTAGITLTVTNLIAAGQNNGYLSLPGIGANYASTPEAAALDITGDITLDAKLSVANWTTAFSAVIAKWTGTAATSAYEFFLASGKLQFSMSTGAATSFVNSSVNVPFGANAIGWIRVTRQQSSGTVQYYTSTDGITWTQLGTNLTLNSGTAINNVARILEIGSYNTGGITSLFVGNIYETRIYNGYQGGGTLVFDANFATKAFGANSFTESSANAATVTINGPVAQAGDGRVNINSATGGSQATISQASGTVFGNYLVLQDSKALGGATFYAGASSINVSNNSGWIFTAAPTSGFFTFM